MGRWEPVAGHESRRRNKTGGKQLGITRKQQSHHLLHPRTRDKHRTGCSRCRCFAQF